jgi:uncharacterized protein YutE (UPF0331/DUF86 family)
VTDQNIIVRKINAIKHNMKRIEQYRDVPLGQFLKDDDIKDIVAHNLFILLQHIIDLGTHIISDENMKEPVFMSDIADILAKENVLDGNLVRPMKSMIGLRNIIAHEYGDIDFKIIHRIMTSSVKDINLILDCIIRFTGL